MFQQKIFLLKFFYQHTFFDDYFEWVPVVDGYGGVIPESPERLASYRPRVPMIIGTTKDETALHFCMGIAFSRKFRLITHFSILSNRRSRKYEHVNAYSGPI